MQRRKLSEKEEKRSLPNTKHDDVAVNMLDATNSTAWDHSNVPFIKLPTLIANTATMNDATIACTCTNAMLPTIIWMISLLHVIRPKLAWVDRRDARHISKFPFKPNNAGTKMNSSEIWVNTFHRCIRKEKWKKKWKIKTNPITYKFYYKFRGRYINIVKWGNHYYDTNFLLDGIGFVLIFWGKVYYERILLGK